MEKLQKLGLPALVGGLILFIFVAKTFVNIGYGEAGVLFKTFGNGVVTDEPPLGEGLNIVMPWNKVYVYNVKQQEVFESKMQVLSSNGLDISLDISVLYQPKIDELGLLHQTKGSNYLNVVIIPSLRAVARSVVGQYTPEQLYSTKRDAIQNEIFEQLVSDVESQHVQINSVLVRDVTQLRRRDRQLISKDATIREIHHRDKNSLQTSSFLLRIQGRRLDSDEAQMALNESVRRIGAIAVVHETLAVSQEGEVTFGEVMRPLVELVKEGLSSSAKPVSI